MKIVRIVLLLFIGVWLFVMIGKPPIDTLATTKAFILSAQFPGEDKQREAEKSLARDHQSREELHRRISDRRKAALFSASSFRFQLK